MGSGIVVLDQPGVAQGYPAVVNFCISDNEPLARYLIDEFFSKFASFRVSPGIQAVTHLPMIECRREGSTLSTYSEIVRSADLEVVATWKNLGPPYAVDMPAENGPTKLHQMYSLFLDAGDGSVTINGRPLAGKGRAARFRRNTQEHRFPRVLRILDASLNKPEGDIICPTPCNSSSVDWSSAASMD